jgi:hypothetical protein
MSLRVPSVDGVQVHQQALAEFEVGRGERFVEQQDLGLVDQGAGDGDPLFLSAGQQAGPLVGVGGEVHQLEHPVHLAADFGRREAGDFRPKGDVLAHREVGKEGVVLEHGVDRPLVGGQGGDVLAVQPHPPVVRLVEAGRNPQQRRLPAPRRPEQRKRLALLDIERDVSDSRERPETPGDILEAEEGSHGRAESRRSGGGLSIMKLGME